VSACHHSWPRSHGQKRCRWACCGRQCRRRRGRRRGRCRGAAAGSARRDHYESEQQQNCQPFHRPLSGGAREGVELPDEIEFTVEDQLGRLRALVQTRRLVGWAPKSPPVWCGPDYGDSSNHAENGGDRDPLSKGRTLRLSGTWLRSLRASTRTTRYWFSTAALSSGNASTS
jgi:hypothetical protein